MASLQWSDELALGQADMDRTHQEFVALLTQVQAADDAQVLACWRAFLAHTQAHFDEEDRWMQVTGFAAENCHAMQHKMVLDVLKQGLQMGEAGDVAPLRQMADELTVWFPMHVDSMDAVLAMHLARVGFDPAAGHLNGQAPGQTSAQTSAQTSGCGGSGACPPAGAGAHALVTA